MIKVNIHDGLIGDFLGAVPAVQALADKEDVLCTYHPEIKELFEMTGLKEYRGEEFEKEIDLRCTDAFQLAIKYDLHMTQAYFPFVGMGVPLNPVRAKMYYSAISVEHYHYIFAPFSRSLPDTQKLSQIQWQNLADLLPGKRIAIIGSLQNERGFIKGDNVKELYGYSFIWLLNILRVCDSVISVISGPSHLAFHLGVKNYLLDNQTCSMRWGVNPDAIKITDPIPTLTAERIMEYL